MRPPESFVVQPVRSLQTMLRILAKVDSRIPFVIPDGKYGPATMQTVSAFQRINDIPVTGVTDQVTWEKIVQAYESAIIEVEEAESIEILLEPHQVFRRGDVSPYLYLAQSMLTQLSLDHISIPVPEHTGTLDEFTVASILAFQKLADLPATGELDRMTWKHLSHHFTLNAHHHAAVFRAKSDDFPQNLF